MRVPLEIAFKNVESTAAMEALIRDRVARLPRYHPEIIACRVMVEAPHRSGVSENLGYRVRIEVSIPGVDVVATRDRSANKVLEEHDPYMAIRDSFNAIERQLKSRAGRRRRGRHSRSGPEHAVVIRLFPQDGYGFIRAVDGREVYFHRNSVINGHFDLLRVGDEVRFEEVEGMDGPQASTVQSIGQHGTRQMT